MDERRPARVLVVDDDRAVRTALERALVIEGYDVAIAADGVGALEQAGEADVMVLDLTMPNLGGLDVCRRLREQGSELPILVLTARHSTADRVTGLDAGADDYLVKPFALEELLARLRVLVRRFGPSPTTPGPGTAGVIRLADLELDAAGHRVVRDGEVIDLTRTEFALLQLLLEHAGQVLTRSQIYDRVWGYEPPDSSNSLDVYIGYLRRKIEAQGRPRLIHTVRGVGYVAREG
jgi:two-component system, OmpR family, response regulator MprA